jgi:PAS domain S-box-containing protein
MGLLVSIAHPGDRPRVDRAFTGAIERGDGFDISYRIVRPDSLQRVVRARAVSEVTDDGIVVRLAGTLNDDSDQLERRAAETRFEIGFDQAGVGAAILGIDGIPIRVNAALCAMLGRPEELLVGRSWTEYNHPDEVSLGGAVQARVSTGYDAYAAERRYLRPDGTIVWGSIHITLVRDELGDPLYYLAQLQDITLRKHMEEELAHQAMHDRLTGLPNRALLDDRLVQGLAGMSRRGPHLGVIFLDLDNFKVVNDSLGHNAGDELIRLIADRIRRRVT